ISCRLVSFLGKPRRQSLGPVWRSTRETGGRACLHCSALLPEKGLRLLKLGALRVRLVAERYELGVQRPGFTSIAGQLSRLRGAEQAAEPIRLGHQRSFEFPQGFLRLVELEEQLTEEPARWDHGGRGDRVLVHRALEVGSGAEQVQRLLALALRPGDERGGRTMLDLHL